MFIRIETILITEIHDRHHKIIDTDFEEIGNGGQYLPAVLDVYVSKKLNVAANLVLFIRWWENKYLRSDGKFFDCIKIWKDEPNWETLLKPYREDIDKYLMLA